MALNFEVVDDGIVEQMGLSPSLETKPSTLTKPSTSLPRLLQHSQTKPPLTKHSLPYNSPNQSQNRKNKMIRGGKSFVTSPPVFSNDAKRLLVCSGSSVSIFSTTTGLPVASLDGHTELVTGVVVFPTNKALNYCYTASLDGSIRYWDFSVPELIKKIDVKFPIYSMVVPPLLSQLGGNDGKDCKLFAYLSVEDKKEMKDKKKALNGQIRKCNLSDSRLVGGLTLAEMKKPEVMTVSSSGKYFGVRVKRKLVIWKVPEKESERAVMKKVVLHHTKTMTVLALHPTQRIVAAGDVTGRILIWRGVGNRTFSVGDGLGRERSTGDDEEKPGVRGDDDADSCTTWHWHPSEVNVLFFSPDGAYLYSGGKEGVLVVWQLDTGKKKYLPRIGSPLLYFTDSPDPTLSSISCADNQVHLLKMPSMEILKSISGIKSPCSFPEISKALRSRVAFDQKSGLVAIRTENYSVQLYSLFDDRGVFEVQVCERNHQPSDEITVVVTLVVLSPDGSTMGTAEVKLAEEGIGGLISLKFWESESLNKEYILSTIVYEPHRDAEISAIAFHPTHSMAVSSSYGGDFKIWVRNNAIQKNDDTPTNAGWTCHAVSSYKKKQMTAAAFSSDGSVLAVAAETVITLWDPKTNLLVAVIGETLTPIVTLSFVGKSDLLAASWGSNPQLSVWSMSKLSLSWSYRLHVEAVASTTDSSYFAVLALLPQLTKHNKSGETTVTGRDGMILLFGAADAVPISIWLVKKAKCGGIAFLQGNQSLFGESMLDDQAHKLLLAFMNGDHEYVLFDPHGKEACELTLNQREGFFQPDEAGKFGYASIYGDLPEFVPKRSQASLVQSVSSERPWESIFSGSSHNLPPLTKLCSTFLESLLEKRTTAVE